MSEYQRYEFICIDRPLAPEEMAELRSISTRAEITPTSFTNVYSFGDLKADPTRLLAQYFDAHLYFANWGTRRLMFRLPAARLDLRRLKPYFPGGAAGLKRVGGHIVIDLCSDSEDPEDLWYEDGRLGVLSTLRDQILQGDLAPCYLAWLLAVECEDVPASRREPRVPGGLRAPGAAMKSMIEFLRIDPDLVAAAAESSDDPDSDDSTFLAWVKSRTAREKDDWLFRAARHPDLPLGNDLLSAFRREQPPRRHAGRTVSQILARREEIRRGGRRAPGRQPTAAVRRALAEVEAFAAAIRESGYADPGDVEEYLRAAVEASLVEDHASARAIFEALMPGILQGEVDLGQDELVDEVLSIDMDECALRHVFSVYSTTPLGERPQAIMDALELVRDLALLLEPLARLESVAPAGLPELEEFLPAWVRRLEEESCESGDWLDDASFWLREAVIRSEGTAGLHRIARESGSPEAFQAWCRALVDEREWHEALGAFEEAADHAPSAEWRGRCLDGAALAAHQLGRRDLTRRLKDVWQASPSMARLRRWLGAGEPSREAIRRRASQALASCPEVEHRQLGLLHLVRGDAERAADLLARAPGLGWSSDRHPGHLLFAHLARSHAGGLPLDSVSSLLEESESGWRLRSIDEWEELIDELDDPPRPSLSTPGDEEILELAAPAETPSAEARSRIMSALRAAAEARVAGVLGEKRRNHYAHAATLVACVRDLLLVGGDRTAATAWVADVKGEYARFPRFQAELKQALG